MKSFLLIFTLAITTNIFGQTHYAKTSVFFETDKYFLAENSKLKIDSFLITLKEFDLKKIILKGNTDSDADSAYNIQLSKNRAESVKSYLTANNIAANIIEYKYYGENKPIAGNATEPGKQLNRRVEIIVVYDLKPEIIVENKQEEEKEKIAIEKCKGGDTTFTLEGGTIITMDKCEYLKKKKCIVFDEMVTFDQIVASGMITNDSRGNTMVSTGMFALNLKDGCGKCLDKEITVRIPIIATCPFSFMKLWTMGNNGNWVDPQPVNEVVVNGRNYIEVKMRCSGTKINGDCLMLDKTCPCWKNESPIANIGEFEIKAFGDFKINEIRVVFNKPISADGEINAKGKKSFQIDAMPHTGDPIVNITAKKPDGTLMIMFSKPLSELQHSATVAGNNLFSTYYITEQDFDIVSEKDYNYRFN